MPDDNLQSILSEIDTWPEERFHDPGAETVSRIQMDLTMVADPGVWLAAPRSAPVSGKPELPLLMLRHVDAVRDWEVSWEANTVLIASNLEGAPLEPCFAFPSTKRWEPGSWGSRLGPEPDTEEREVFTNKLDPLDARVLCNLPWKPGRYAFTLIAYDWKTKTVTVDLTGERPALHPVPRERAESLRRSLHPKHFSAVHLPSYVASDFHRPLDGLGVAIRLPSRVISSGSYPVLGTVRVEMPAHALVDGPRDAAGDYPVGLLEGEILVIELDNPHRGMIPVTVPVYAKPAETVQPGQTVEAHFAIDVKPHIQPPLMPGEYLVYFVLLEYVSEPVRVEIAGEPPAEDEEDEVQD